MLLQVDEPAGKLDIDQDLRARQLLRLEDLAGDERPLELAHEPFVTILQDFWEAIRDSFSMTNSSEAIRRSW